LGKNPDEGKRRRTLDGWWWGLLMAYGVVLLVWGVRLVLVQIIRRQLVFLTPASPRLEGNADLPSVSILVPARNEAETIAECLQSLLALDYPNLDIIVIDDRSTDPTAAIVRELAQNDRRIHLQHIHELPPGWTGKTHALHEGVQHVTSDWLLFVDADTAHHPANLRIMLHHALAEEAALVSLLPTLSSRSFWEKVVQPLAGVVLMLFFPVPRVNSEHYPRSAFANGQYILVRRSAYEQIGGHAAVRTHFVEDINLGRRIKQAGLRLRIVIAGELTTVRMYASLADIRRGWSRIYYGAVDYRPWKLLAMMLAIVAFSFSAYLCLALAMVLFALGHTSPPVWLLLLMSWVHQALIVAVLAPLYTMTRSRLWYLAFYLPASALLWLILARAVWLCFTHRVTWRDTSYGPELTAYDT
jgi:chlorobactene glucosyltransferase